MDYLSHYNNLCTSRYALKEQRSFNKINGSYFERHHIKPRCVGGSDDEDNLVLLTGREHFVAHCLLAMIAKKELKGKNKRNLL